MQGDRSNGCRNGQQMYYVFEVFLENENDGDSKNSLKLCEVVDGVIRVSGYRGEFKTIYHRVADELSSLKKRGILRKRKGSHWAFDWDNPKNKKFIPRGGEHYIDWKIKKLREKSELYGW